MEADTARRYGWTFNNCQHFVRDLLRAGGPIPERYFPKHFVAELLRGPPPEPLSDPVRGSANDR